MPGALGSANWVLAPVVQKLAIRLAVWRSVCLFFTLACLAGCGAGSEPSTSTTESGVGQSSIGTAQSVAHRPEQTIGLKAVVTQVVDGDTIIVRVNDQSETVRLLGIDTPEKAGGPRPAECFGAAASERLAELLPLQTPVLLSRDQESRDQYSRLLAFVHRADDGLFVNLTMIEEGYATPLFFAPNRAAEDRFSAAGDAARRNWIGFWPACGGADIVIQD